MKWNVVILALWGGWPSGALAGEIFGVITEAGLPVTNAPVEVEQDGQSVATRTDARGSYRVVVPESGRATMTVKTAAGSHSIDVFSSNRSLRYDLMLVAGELKRR